MNDLWSPSECSDCVQSCGIEAVERSGIPACKNQECGFNCFMLDEDCALRGNPWHRITAGSLEDALCVANEVISMSSRDSQGLPTADGFLYWSGEIATSERMFWKVVSQVVRMRKAETVEEIKRLQAKHG